MKEMMMKLAAVAIMATLASGALAQDAARVVPPYEQAPNGKARIAAFPEPDAKTGEVVIPLLIDLKDVLWNDQPAVLGGYVVRVKFDREQVAFVGAAGGTDPYFAASPVATAPEIANQRGWVKVAYAQLHTLQPIGMVNVARLRFVERVSGGASSIDVVLESASSALQRDNEGNLMRRLTIEVENGYERQRQ